ncbi:MAG: polysaccharide deacetylase family protein [Clostridia bacterium]|nr:polysaccharide deacetylase family protein [Clostridia bacterium]
MTLQNETKIDTNYYPGFVRKSVTFTLDDGIYQYDKKVVDILKPYGFTGTFNINDPSTVTDPTIYDGFEVANHHILHAVAEMDKYAALEKVNTLLPENADTTKVYLKLQKIDGKEVEGLYYVYIGGSWHAMASNETYIEYLEWTTEELDKMFGEGTVVGFAYPHGNQYNDAIVAYLKEAGYLYGRRAGNLKATTGFALPTDRYTWTYNADHTCLLMVMADYDAYADDGQLKMFSFGVHAKDFETNNKWDDLKEFARLYGNRPSDFWYATNRQIFEYEDAIKALEISEEKIVNPSPIAVYITVNNEKVIIPANSVYYLDGSVKAQVTFDEDNGLETKKLELDVNSFISEPNVPEKAGYIFDGWYVDGKK